MSEMADWINEQDDYDDDGPERAPALTCSECGFTEPLTEQVTREAAEQDGWLLGEVVYCPKCGPDDSGGE